MKILTICNIISHDIAPPYIVWLQTVQRTHVWVWAKKNSNHRWTRMNFVTSWTANKFPTFPPVPCQGIWQQGEHHTPHSAVLRCTVAALCFPDEVPLLLHQDAQHPWQPFVELQAHFPEHTHTYTHTHPSMWNVYCYGSKNATLTNAKDKNCSNCDLSVCFGWKS